MLCGSIITDQGKLRDGRGGAQRHFAFARAQTSFPKASGCMAARGFDFSLSELKTDPRVSLFISCLSA